MKNFYIVVNTEKENSEVVREYIKDYLASRGGTCVSSSGTFVKGKRFTDLAEIPEETDCVITLGGDGTLIRAARDFAKRNIPIIGINLGGVGYLTEIGREDDIKDLLEALLADRYEIQERMMLKGTVYHDGEAVAKDIALNDIVMNREGDMRVLKFRIYVDGEFLNEYSADGIIVATPTGSTAYNLSAGGPIAQPNGQLMILTPVCPHTLTSRAIVLGAENRVRIEISESSQGSQVAVYDGDTRVPMACGDYIEIERSKRVTRVVKLDHRSFFDILKEKLQSV